MDNEENDDLIYDTRGTCFVTACGVEGKLCPDCAMGHKTKNRRLPVVKLDAYYRQKQEIEQLQAENAKLFEIYMVAREIYPLRHLALPIEDSADDPKLLFDKIKKLSGPLTGLIPTNEKSTKT